MATNGSDGDAGAKAPLVNGSKKKPAPTEAHGKVQDAPRSDAVGRRLAVKYQNVPKSDFKPKKDVATANENNDKEMEEWNLVPPDGGWGWLVLFGSTLVNILVPGTVKSFGVLFVEFLEVFEASPAAAAWIPALCYFLYSSLGPVSSILSLKYSYRTVTIIGGTCAAVGMILSFFAQSVTYLYMRTAEFS